MPENTLILYEPRKILDLAEEEGKVAPADLGQFGYSSTDASAILLRLCAIGYLEMSGRKTVTPAAYFETGDGELKKASGMRIQSAYKITDKGMDEKPPLGEKYWLEMAPLDLTDFEKIVGNFGAGGMKGADAFLAGLKDERGRTIQQALRDELYSARMHAQREDLKLRLKFAVNKLFGRHVTDLGTTQK